MDVLVAKAGNAHYSYGMSHPQRMALTANVAPSASFVVTYTGFGAFPAAQAAFQAAVDIWSQTIVSPVPIRVDAKFETLGNTGVLGTAGPTQVCSSPFGVANTLYAAALADALNGSGSCASGSPSEITARFNSDFTNWDFGTSGTGVTNEYNFMTVVLHELGHGLGFYGSMSAATNGLGSFSNPPDIYDRFAITGDGMPLLNFTNPSSALGAQLISDNTFWNGARAVANNGSTPKLETHDFTTFGEPTPFRHGSSYSHVDEDLYSLTPNGLMTWALEAAEVYTDPGPIMRGMMQDEGWAILGAPCAYSLIPASTTVAAAGGSASVAINAGAGSTCAWSAASNSSFITLTGTTSGTGSANIGYTVTANGGASQRTGTVTIGGQTFTVIQNGTGPTMALDRDTLVFGAATNGAAFITKTSTQAVRLTKSGAGTVTWTASSNKPWLTVTPASGSGSATLTVGVQFAPGLAATQGGVITLTFTGAGNAAGPVDVSLNIIQNGTTAVPFGSFDTPINNSTGVTGSIGLTGWALDDIEVTRVRVLRDPVAGEAPGVLIPIGTAVLVDGARTDVGILYPTSPLFSRGGWGYLMLTNMLPSQGNGAFKFYAYADDPEGHSQLLGTKTITCSNSTATAPFGAIDTPQQGEVVSGVVNNFGWVLARGTVHADPPGGGTVTVVIDGVPAGVPGGWTNRSDLTTLFSTGFTDLSSALAVHSFDSAALTNGVHTIAWGVTATNSDSAGIGSRYFTVSNGASSLVAGLRAGGQAAGRSLVVKQAGSNASAALTAAIDAAPTSGTAMTGRAGWSSEAPERTYPANSKGRVVVDGEELGLFNLRPGVADGSYGVAPAPGGTYAGYLRAGDALGPLPVGSRLDLETGAFTWQPGVGFTGPYDFVFTRCPASAKTSGAMAGGCVRQEVRLVLHPKGSNRVGPQVTIDLPAADARVPGRFVVAGWAIDLDDTVGTGVDALHVWAYPRSACGNSGACSVPPIFLGATAYGGSRPDVGAIYGDRFSASGYGLVVDGLEPGTYDIAVFAWSTARGGFVPAKTVRVIVPYP
jgi:hypothetical protein